GHLNTNGAHIKDAVVNKGGKVIRQYIFPEHFVEIGKGDKVFLRLVVINSYDGSCGFQVQAGGFRVVCTNGLVSGERFLSLDIRHTGNCDFAKITQKIMTAIKSFDAMGNYWKKMLNTPIEQKQSDFLLTKVAT
ncbi:DUF932 domain-containing protein, partial [Vibrio anguillarum]|nr:DUF932 domain-containing protein [Vibrio anguillarum]